MADGRLLTGSADLDRILGGGLIPGSTIVIAGSPGTGKTLLAQQICFANARQEAPALYYTTWSEPHAKLLRNLSYFSYFDEAAIGLRIDFLHLPAVLEEGGGWETVVSELLRATVERRPAIVVIDSSKALHGLVQEDRLRRVLYELASRVGQLNTVLLLVGEYTPEEIEQSPEFAVADGILQLTNEPRGLDDRRSIRVLKMRGSANLSGRHSISIDSTGFSAYPRLETMVPPVDAPLEGRASLGDAGLDAAMGGGIPKGDGSLLLGPSGVGKTVLALSFMADGARKGENGLYLTLQETSEELLRKAAALGWPEIPEAVAAGRLRIQHVQPIDPDLDRFGVLLRDRIAELQPQRVVVDSIAELDLNQSEPDRFLSYLWAAVRLIRSHGATGLFTQETAMLGPTPAGALLSFIFQNVFLMRFLEHESELQRAITAFKMRDSAHQMDPLRFEIDAKGFRTTGQITGIRGLLGWTVLRAGPEA